MSLSFRRKSPRSLVTLAALSAGALSLGACAHNVATETSLPANGTALLQRMHDRYAGHWYKTLTFVQKTTQYPPNAAPRISTWYESLRGDRLRIDFGNPSAGNGVIYTPDSGYVFRAGKLVRSLADGNIFLPLISSVYVLPMSSTLAQLAPYHFDLSRIRSDTWEGRPVFVVGARDARDLESPQFWVDAERLIVVRFVAPLIPNGKAKAQDIRLEKNVPVAGGWLATRVRMLDADQPLQTEEYTDWHANVTLPPHFFDPAHWSEGTHWAASIAK
jgi:hypothetical protein